MRKKKDSDLISNSPLPKWNTGLGEKFSLAAIFREALGEISDPKLRAELALNAIKAETMVHTVHINYLKLQEQTPLHSKKTTTRRNADGSIEREEIEFGSLDDFTEAELREEESRIAEELGISGPDEGATPPR